MFVVRATEQKQRTIFLKMEDLCLGSVDGNYVGLKAPLQSASQYYNYKCHHSIVLAAIMHVAGTFPVADVVGFWNL